MDKIFCLYADAINSNGKNFVEDLMCTYVGELVRHCEWFGDDIPMINYGERCQVGFMVMGLTHKFREKYAVIQEYKSSNTDSYPDLGVLKKNGTSDGHQYYLLEIKYFSNGGLDYSILEYNQAFFEKMFTYGKVQLNSYYLTDKEFCDKNQAIGITLILRPFFYEKQEEYPLEDYRDLEKRRAVNENIVVNEELIKKSGNKYFTLYRITHIDKEKNRHTVAFEIFGCIDVLTKA